MEQLAEWIENLRRYPTLAALRSSEFHARCGGDISRFLSTPEIAPSPGATPRLAAFVRAAQWNIEKGRRFEAIARCLHTDPVLQHADIILLNEADRGMGRSGNRHVAVDLGRELGMHVVFGPAHIELTGGTGEDLAGPRGSGGGLQGNAILTRHPVSEARVVPLPVCFEPFEFHEKRFGRRNCVWARVTVRGTPLWIGSTHLEVRNSPRCRAAQMRHIVRTLPGGEGEPCLLGGDLNSNGFSRGTRLRTLASAARLVFSNPVAMRPCLVRPDRRVEPLFRVAGAAGFSWREINSEEETATTPIDSLEDSDLLPPFLARLIRRRMAAYGGRLDFRLDWLLERGLRPLSAGAAADAASGERSRDPGRIPLERTGTGRASDHNPIHADFCLAG